MPRDRRSQGRPGTPVFPAGWAASHQPVAEKTMVSATVALRHPGTVQDFDEESQQMVAVPFAPYFTGPARVQILDTRDQVKVTAGDREVVVSYLVVVPAAVVPAELDLVTVTDVDDPALVGRTLLVAVVQTGSLIWERDLLCSLTA